MLPHCLRAARRRRSWRREGAEEGVREAAVVAEVEYSQGGGVVDAEAVADDSCSSS